MAGLILCRSEEASKPYYMPSLGIFISSVEELAYAIYNNVYLLSSDFLDDELIRFLKEETKDTWLAGELKFLREKNAGLREITVTILLYVDYYTKKEVDDFRGLIDHLGTLTHEEKVKRRGDNFLVNEKYESAIKNYIMILNEEHHSMKDDFYGNVFHNIAVCYARLFFFEHASECFKMAYDLNGSQESLESYIATASLAGVRIPEEEVDGALKAKVEARMEALSKEVFDRKEYIRIGQIHGLKNSGKYTEYQDQLKNVFDTWKSEYIAMMQ